MSILDTVAQMQKEDSILPTPQPEQKAPEPVTAITEPVLIPNAQPQQSLLANKNVDEEHMVSSAVVEAARQATSLKQVIDVGITGKALQEDGVVEQLTERKKQELQEDALAKVIASEAARIKQETDRLTEEGRKQLAELQNQINQAQAEKEKLQKEADKCTAYFNSHKNLLKYAGCKQVMSLKYMQVYSKIGFVVQCLLTILFSPLIVAGQLLELLCDIVEGITGKIKAGAGKIVVTVLLFIFLGLVILGSCYLLKVFVFKSI